MENSSFVPNHLGTPALMVLASTAENHDGARMPGPHNFPGQDKDVPTFSNAFAMYRPGDHFPPPLYTNVSPFVRPGLERSVGFLNPVGNSAFRPVSTESAENYHSAFSPAKRSKNEDTGKNAYHEKSENADRTQEVLNERDLHDNAIKDERPSSLNSALYESNSETHSDSGEFDRTTPDAEGRNLRKQRKKILDGQTPCCPICGLTLRLGETEQHFTQELEKLEKLSRSRKNSKDVTPQGRKCLPSPSSGRRGKDSPSLEAASHSRYDSYLRIRCNRQGRLQARSRSRKKKATEETICPVCSERLVGTPEELNEHAELCLKKQREGEENDPVDVDGDTEQYEEYTWAGQTRIRVTSLLDGGFSGSGFQTACKRGLQEEDVDLNVDGDDSVEYGQPQYGEADIIPCSSDEPSEDKERQALRGAVLSSSITDAPVPVSNLQHDHIEGAHHMKPIVSNILEVKVKEEDTDNLDGLGGSAQEIIEALKDRLKQRETAHPKHKCLICMEPYVKPLASIQCWHVHCEECWLKTLGAKKLCPQCNMITSPADLRRIYL
ncbi:hypothetical protein ACJMK2_042366 [Sinanodonta woodiana]|uniref:RING-type domain-containing protein n=1 Tax=Sinanodonta woodiana TaxID=1069815 RepID=A0ABD3W733_SINWO